nr:MAG TPA: hypothetical protein [Caudoviricetes sp.]
MACACRCDSEGYIFVFVPDYVVGDFFTIKC